MTGEEMLTPELWLRNIKCNLPTWTHEECNRSVAKHNASVCDLLEVLKNGDTSYPLPLPPSTRDPRVLYSQDSEALDDSFWEKLLPNARYTLFKRPLPGFSIRLSDVRRYPAQTSGFRTPTDREFDQFQETTLHTFEPVLVVGESQDGVWYCIVSTTYAGWVRQDDVALCSEEDFFTFSHGSPVCVAAGLGVSTQVQPYRDAVSAQPVEFAAVLPLCRESADYIGNQSPIGNVRVLWPIRDADGQFSAEQVFLRKQPNLSIGYLPFTRESVVRMAFQLLGERYGWGGRLGLHDCSSFVMDVYRTMGIQLARNTGGQEKSLPSVKSIPETATSEERHDILCQLDAGDLLFMPGHVMLYLGVSERQHYIIHDFTPMNEVMVTAVDITTQQGRTYLDSFTGSLNLFSRVIGVNACDNSTG